MTAGKQILISLVIGVVVGFVIGYISQNFGSSWGILIVVVLGLTAIISYLTVTEKSSESEVHEGDNMHEHHSNAVGNSLDALNVKDNVTLSGDDARKWLDELMVKQQSQPKS